MIFPEYLSHLHKSVRSFWKNRPRRALGGKPAVRLCYAGISPKKRRPGGHRGGGQAVSHLFKAGLILWIRYYAHIGGVRMQADMRRDVFKRLQKLPFSFFDEHKTGSLMSRVVNDLMDISELAHHGPEDLFLSLITIIGAFVLLCTINVPLTIIIFIFVPIMVAFSVYIRREMNAAFLLTRQEMAEINANLENSIAGIRVSRSYVSGAHEEKKFQHYNDRFQAARGESYRVMAKFFSTTGFFTDFMYLVVLVAGGLFFFYGKIDAGGFTAYLLYVNMFLNPVRKLINFFEQLQNGATGFQRFEELMAQQEEAEDPNAKELTDVKAELSKAKIQLAGREIGEIGELRRELTRLRQLEKDYNNMEDPEPLHAEIDRLQEEVKRAHLETLEAEKKAAPQHDAGDLAEIERLKQELENAHKAAEQPAPAAEPINEQPDERDAEMQALQAELKKVKAELNRQIQINQSQAPRGKKKKGGK